MVTLNYSFGGENTEDSTKCEETLSPNKGQRQDDSYETFLQRGIHINAKHKSLASFLFFDS